MFLSLGDIIKIISPQNDDLHEKTFFIDYLDSSKIKLIDIADENLTKYEIRLKENGAFADETIQQIQLLSRSPDEGFARQNGLLPGQWIEIHMGGDLPQIIVGEITNLEEDMIEMRTFPEREYIYIDFEYKGIPEEYPIIKFVLREAPETAAAAAAAAATAEEEEEEAALPPPAAAESTPAEDEPPEIDVREISKQLFFDIDEIVIGQKLESVTEVTDVARGQERYGLETQIHDIMDQLLAAVPIQKRTPTVLNRIHTAIERYKVLRDVFSHTDKYGVVTGVVKKGHLYKPFLEPAANLDVKLKWILPVVTNSPKLYRLGEDEVDDADTDAAADIDAALLKYVDSQNALYYKNSGQTATNKYIDYLQLNREFFENTDTDPASGAMITRAVNTKLETVLSPIDKFYSTVMKNGAPARRRYVFQTYNVGETALQPEIIAGSRKTTYSREAVTPADKISIKSFLVLPEPVVRFSAAHLPNTGIMARANLNANYVDMWRILKQNLFVERKWAGAPSGEAAADETPFQKIVEFLPGAAAAAPDAYINLLNEIIPRTKILFQMMQKYINEYSLLGILNYMEPFLIYSDDISFKQYTNFRWFLRHKIADLKHARDERRKKLNTVRSAFENATIKKINSVYDLFMSNAKQDALNILIELYGLPAAAAPAAASSEVLARVLEQDDATLFMLTLSNLTATLTSHEDIMSFIDKFEIQDIGELEKLKPRDKKCADRKFSKKYSSMEQLRADDGKAIFYDKEYDNTPYKLLEDADIKQARAQMAAPKFAAYLRANLEEKHGLSGDALTAVAEALLSGKRAVQNGDYAVLVDQTGTATEGYAYFRRQNSAWVKDTSIDEEAADTNAEFCRSSASCDTGAAAGDCNSLGVLSIQARENAKKQMKAAFNERVKYTIQEVRDQITRNIERSTKNLKRRKLLREWNARRADEVAGALARDLNKIFEKTTDSPYIPLRDYILASTDYPKKQNMVLQFAQKYCNEFTEDEPHWLLCKETNTRLFPYSLFLIADAFINKRPTFMIEMGKIRAVYGAVDEDRVVDKFTGYVLCATDLTREDTYDESGFKITAHEVLEDMRTMEEKVISAIEGASAPTAAAAAAAPAPRVFENEITEKIYNVAKTLARNLFIPFELIEKNVLENAQSILERNLKFLYDKEGYDREMDRRAKKNPDFKKISHENYKHETLIWITAGMVLIAAQTAIPHINIRKTFPQCVMSFEGFPFDDSANSSNSALEYIACVINKTRSSVAPWDAIKFKKEKAEETYVKKLRAIIQTYLLADEKVAELIKQKREYLETYQPEEKIPAQLRIEKWRQFMPPIVRFEMGDVAPIAKEFLEDLERLVKTENRNQRGQIGVIHGKIKQYTYGIIEAINRIVAEEQPLMKTAGGVPFLENSCCSGTPPGHDVLLYFANKNHAIAKYVEQSARLEDIVRKINMKPPILFAPPSGRAGIQEIPANFDNKELIYGAFIHYCRLDVDVPAPPELLAISPRKIEGMKSSWSIQEKILFMENNGVKLTREKLETLMALVGARNRAIAAPTAAAAAATPDPEDEFDFLKKELVFVEKLYNASADGATAADSMNLRIYVEKVTTNNPKHAEKEMNMYRTIRAFLEKNSVSTRDYNMFSAFLAGAQFENWKTPTQGAMFYENAILYMTKIIPGVFLNGNSPTDKVKIPKHWDLSSQHNNLLETNIKALNGINPFLSIVRPEVMRGVFQKIAEEFKNIGRFMKYTADSRQLDIPTKMYIYKFLFFHIFCEYINAIPNKINRTLRKSRAAAAAEPTVDMSTAEEIDVEKYKALARDEDPENTLGGNEQELNRAVFQVLMEYINVFTQNKKKINQTFQEIYDGATRVKYREKEEMKKYFELMTQEERDVEKVLMKHSLGKWNKGKQKSVYAYDKEAFDEELGVAERLAVTDAIYTGAADEGDTAPPGDGLYEVDMAEDERTDIGEGMDRNNMFIEGDLYADGEQPDDDMDDEYVTTADD